MLAWERDREKAAFFFNLSQYLISRIWLSMPVFTILKPPSALHLPWLLSCLYVLPQRRCTSHSSSLAPAHGASPGPHYTPPFLISLFFCTEQFNSSHEPSLYCIHHSALHLGHWRDHQSTVWAGPLLSAQKEIRVSPAATTGLLQESHCSSSVLSAASMLLLTLHRDEVSSPAALRIWLLSLQS